MLKNYLKIAWRNLLRNKAFSAINIFGLAVGMASAILIVLWIQNEVSYDRFHQKQDRIYEAWNRALRPDGISSWAITPKVLAKTLKNDFPEVEKVARVNWLSSYLFSIGDKRLLVQGNIVDPDFLNIFSFPLLKGNPKTVLGDVNSIVLTEKLAQKLFGNEDAIGKTIKLDNKDNFTVTGILKDIPTNTRFKFEFLLSWAYLKQFGGDDEFWGNNSTLTYVLLKPNANLASIAPKLKKLRARYDKDDPKAEMFLYPISRWRMYSVFKDGVEEGGRITYVKLFGLTAIFILLIACINFMNLSTARSEKRAKEVGIRKVVGAQKASLIGQFIGESVLLAGIAGIIAVIIAQLALPAFSRLTGEELALDYVSMNFWLGGVAFVLLTGITAGSYPAFFLSSFKPVAVLKGTFKKANALITPRRILVVLQFTFAILLIICTVVVKQQIDYAQNRESGYNKKDLIYHFLTGDLAKNYILIKNELLSAGIATAISKTSAPLTENWSNSWGFEWPGKDPNNKTVIDRFSADENLAVTAGFQFVKGRDFDLKKYPADSTAVILNEAAVRVMGLKSPIGQIIKDGYDWHIVGVIKDFILQSPYEPMQPMVIEGGKSVFFNVIHIKLNSKNETAQNLENTERIFKKYNPEYPFEYHFIDEQYAKKFEDEKRIGVLAGTFSGLTILISCLGLLALATYMAENRIKEIGIRKVLGASVAGITALLSKDFLILVIISFFIASPIAWWAMNEWLKEYTYRIEISLWIFMLSGALAVLIALLTVSFQAIKAALANPVKSLRTE